MQKFIIKVSMLLNCTLTKTRWTENTFNYDPMSAEGWTLTPNHKTKSNDIIIHVFQLHDTIVMPDMTAKISCAKRYPNIWKKKKITVLNVSQKYQCQFIKSYLNISNKIFKARPAITKTPSLQKAERENAGKSSNKHIKQKRPFIAQCPALALR